MGQQEPQHGRLSDILGKHEAEILAEWVREQAAAKGRSGAALREPELREQCGSFLAALRETSDSARTQLVMESLFERILESSSSMAILDITGVPTVDTLTAQHLIKTVTAARLMGAECIISGVRPQIAQAIVHLGVDLGDVTTKATLADAFALALKRTRRAVVRRSGGE